MGLRPRRGAPKGPRRAGPINQSGPHARCADFARASFPLGFEVFVVLGLVDVWFGFRFGQGKIGDCSEDFEIFSMKVF